YSSRINLHVSPSPFPGSSRYLHPKQPRRNLRTASPQGATMIGLLIGAAALGGGFVTTRNFVRRRLRFVDAAQKPAVPLLVGLAATAVALCSVAKPSATARIFTVTGSGRASMSQSSPTIS